MVAARRGGETRRGPLTKSGCRLAGSVQLDGRGRWFVYAEMRRGGRDVESWLPISVGSGPARISDRARYAYVPPERSSSTIKLISGVLLYAGMLAMLYVTFRLLRARRPGAGLSIPLESAAMTAAIAVVADHGSLSSSLFFFGPVALMLVALAIVTLVDRRRRR